MKVHTSWKTWENLVIISSVFQDAWEHRLATNSIFPETLFPHVLENLIVIVKFSNRTNKMSWKFTWKIRGKKINPDFSDLKIVNSFPEGLESHPGK